MGTGDISGRWPDSVATAYGAGGGPWHSGYMDASRQNYGVGPSGKPLAAESWEKQQEREDRNEHHSTGANTLLPMSQPDPMLQKGIPVGGVDPMFQPLTAKTVPADQALSDYMERNRALRFLNPYSDEPFYMG